MGTTESLLYSTEEEQQQQVAQLPPIRPRRPAAAPTKWLRGWIVGGPSTGKYSLLQRLQGKDPFDGKTPKDETRAIEIPYKPPPSPNDKKQDSSFPPPSFLAKQRIRLSLQIVSGGKDERLEKAVDFVVLCIHPKESLDHVQRRLQALVRLLSLPPQLWGYHGDTTDKPSRRPICMLVCCNFADVQQNTDDEKEWHQRLTSVVDYLRSLWKCNDKDHNDNVLLYGIQTSWKECMGLVDLHGFVYRSYLLSQQVELETKFRALQAYRHHQWCGDLPSSALSYRQFHAMASSKNDALEGREGIQYEPGTNGQARPSERTENDEDASSTPSPPIANDPQDREDRKKKTKKKKEKKKKIRAQVEESQPPSMPEQKEPAARRQVLPTQKAALPSLEDFLASSDDEVITAKGTSRRKASIDSSEDEDDAWVVEAPPTKSNGGRRQLDDDASSSSSNSSDDSHERVDQRKLPSSQEKQESPSIQKPEKNPDDNMDSGYHSNEGRPASQLPEKQDDTASSSSHEDSVHNSDQSDQSVSQSSEKHARGTSSSPDDSVDSSEQVQPPPVLADTEKHIDEETDALKNTDAMTSSEAEKVAAVPNADPTRGEDSEESYQQASVAVKKSSAISNEESSTPRPAPLHEEFKADPNDPSENETTNVPPNIESPQPNSVEPGSTESHSIQNGNSPRNDATPSKDDDSEAEAAISPPRSSARQAREDDSVDEEEFFIGTVANDEEDNTSDKDDKTPEMNVSSPSPEEDQTNVKEEPAPTTNGTSNASENTNGPSAAALAAIQAAQAQMIQDQERAAKKALKKEKKRKKEEKRAKKERKKNMKEESTGPP